ncbi:uncharacterized protein JCM15063_004576 [Sporobolomyces koalae]|uniref:uncharacterized protein n=1 Tax=Sporobolomyces koalae TaxID=500713 RepID=UPI003170B9E4
MSSDDRSMYQFPAGAGELSLDSLETPNWSPTPSPSPSPPSTPVQAVAELPVSRAPLPPSPPPPPLSQSRPGVIGRSLATEQTVVRALTDEAEIPTPASSPRPVPSGSRSTAQGQAVLGGESEPGAQDTLSLPRWSTGELAMQLFVSHLSGFIETYIQACLIIGTQDNDIRVRALTELQQGIRFVETLPLDQRREALQAVYRGERPWQRHSLPDDHAAVHARNDNTGGATEG